jgi:hypothetical protein
MVALLATVNCDSVFKGGFFKTLQAIDSSFQAFGVSLILRFEPIFANVVWGDFGTSLKASLPGAFESISAFGLVGCDRLRAVEQQRGDC